jgi:hypothetical protein
MTMARKSVQREFEDAQLAEIILSLDDGAHDSGTTLTTDECALLLRRLPPMPLAPEPPRWFVIAEFSYHQEDRVGSVKAAVGDTIRKFDVSRSEVFAARQRYREFIWL